MMIIVAKLKRGKNGNAYFPIFVSLIFFCSTLKEITRKIINNIALHKNNRDKSNY